MGIYHCHFGADVITNRYNKKEYEHNSQMQNITVFDGKSSQKQETKVEYFESFYTKGVKSKLLMQCVVTGGPLTWYIRPQTTNCSRRDENDSSCSKTNLINLEEVAAIDVWRCYTYQVERHSPHPDIMESLIFFQNICPVDWGSVHCGVAGEGGAGEGGDGEKIVMSDGELIMQKSQWSNYWWWYDVPNMITHLSLFLLVPILSIFFITGGIIAIIRGKVCISCCHNRSFQVNQPYHPTILRYQAPRATNDIIDDEIAGTSSTSSAAASNQPLLRDSPLHDHSSPLHGHSSPLQMERSPIQMECSPPQQMESASSTPNLQLHGSSVVVADTQQQEAELTDIQVHT